MCNDTGFCCAKFDCLFWLIHGIVIVFSIFGYLQRNVQYRYQEKGQIMVAYKVIYPQRSVSGNDW